MTDRVRGRGSPPPADARETRLVVAGAAAVEGTRDPAGEVLTSLPLLHHVAREGGPAVVRVFSPEPTVAFSRRESLHPRFAAAAAAARAGGYLPIIRPAGGRAVVLDSDWLVVDLICPEADRAVDGDVFRSRGEQLVTLARRWGIDARLGPVPGEYCPGTWSVNARGRRKLIGTAQRVVRGARLFTASVPLRISERVHGLLGRMNDLLDLPWDPATLGSLAEETTVSADAVHEDLVAAFAGPDAPSVPLVDVLRAPAAGLAGIEADRVVTDP